MRADICVRTSRPAAAQRARMARVIPFPEDAPDAVLKEALRVLRQDGVIAMATESLYALGASVGSATAVRRVCAMKRRPQRKPILVLIGERAQLTPLVLEVTPAASLLIERFWPGPLTIVLRAASGLA